MRQQTKSAPCLLSKASSLWMARVVAAPGGLECHNCENFRLLLLSASRTTRMRQCPREIRFDTQDSSGSATLISLQS